MVAGKQPSVMPFLHNYKCNRRLIIRLQGSTSFPNCVQLIQKNLVKLAFTDSISVAKTESGQQTIIRIKNSYLAIDCDRRTHTKLPQSKAIPPLNTDAIFETSGICDGSTPVKDDAQGLFTCRTPERDEEFPITRHKSIVSQ